MLSVKEREFVKELLVYLNDEDLISLTKTTTNDLVPTSRSDAISAILLHTETVDVLLSRKKITKEVLFKYLHDRQQSVSLSEHKEKLKKRILELLGISDRRRNVKFEIDNYNHENRSDDSGAGSDISGSEDYDRGEENSHLCGVPSSTPQAHSAEVPYVAPERGSYGSFIGNVDVVQHDNTTTVHTGFPVTEFSQQFVSWFYSLLNAGGVEEEHLWTDAAAEMLLLPGEQVNRGSTAKGVSELLGWVRNHLGLVFNPNVTGEGVHGRSDPHGLMIVLVCGTLHTVDRCVGTFTQKFALARDPFSNNNWKVKNTKGILRCPGNALDGGTLITPTLDNVDSDLALLEPP